MRVSKNRKELLLRTINRKEPRAYNEREDVCVYDHNYHGGCAIGCDIKQDLAFILHGGVAEGFVFEQLPKRLQRMGKDFLNAIQSLHDRREFWINPNTAEVGENGLVWSKLGLRKIESIISIYNVNIKIPALEVNNV